MSTNAVLDSAQPRAARPPDGRARRTTLGRRLWQARWPYLFLLPTVVLFGLYTLVPIVASWWYSLNSRSGFGSPETFVGLDNYRQILGDPLFRNSLEVTLLFMVVTVPVRVGVGLLLALALNHPRLPWARLFRTAFFLPVVTTTAIIGVVSQFVLDPSSGPFAVALDRVGAGPVDFLGSSSSALWTVMAVHTWKWAGVTMIYWLAALQTVPRDLVEAAGVDGASARQRFRHVTLPMLLPFLVIITLLTVEQNLQIFDLLVTMTGGGPFYSTEVIEVYIYRWAFQTSPPELGVASAAAVVLGLILLVAGAVQLLGIRAARRSSGASS